jgi:hypothetical protein
MDLEKKIIEELGTQMQSEMDKEILWGMLKGMGWTRVMIDRFQDNKHAVDITYWLKENCQGAYERNGRDFIFENDGDAVNFILKWK